MSVKVTKKSQKEFVKQMLGTDKKWAIRGLLKIYSRQTEDEQNAGYTQRLNSIGFSGVDGEILSSFAVHVIAGRNLSEKQMCVLFKKMPKYWLQIISLCDVNKLNSLVK